MELKNKVLLAIIIVALLILALLCSDTQDIAQQCCTECRDAFSHSPVGAGPEGVLCAHFIEGGTSEEFFLSKECAEHFQKSPVKVSECMNKNPDGICGPNVMGVDYDVSYCDTSCTSDAGCQFSCGCGAINKNEVCNDEGIIYDCVNHVVNCETNRCVLGEESIPQVLIKTDKTEYSQGEAIKVIARNGLNVPILYYGGERFWGIEYFENNTWKNRAYENGGGFQLGREELNAACYIRLYERIPPDKVDAGKAISQVWNQRICPYGDGNPSKPNFVKYIGLGRYRLTFNYGFDVSSSDAFKIADIETVYSNEFTIK